MQQGYINVCSSVKSLDHLMHLLATLLTVPRGAHDMTMALQQARGICKYHMHSDARSAHVAHPQTRQAAVTYYAVSNMLTKLFVG